MQKNKIKSRMSSSLLLLLTAVFVCINPDNAFADLLGCMESEADQGIFKVIACKITTTLFDIRKIVYIIGGLGLVAFTFAAIFNKISFKHLGYIAFSLFLLSMTTPFIEYFISSDGSVTLTYGNFLPSSFTENDYSNSSDDSCEGEDCPSSSSDDSCEGEDCPSSRPGKDPRDEGLSKEIPKLKEVEIKEPTVPTVPTDTRSTWQKIKDGVKTVKEEAVKAYNTASSVVATASTIYNTVNTTVQEFKNVDSIESALTATFNATNSIQSITGSVTSAAGVMGNNYGDGTWSAKVNDAFSGINQIATDVGGMTKDTQMIHGAAKGAMDLPNDVMKIFKK